MKIEKFGAADIADATLIADLLWEGEYENFEPKFAKTMAEYIIRSAFLNEDMAFKITENNALKASILAARKADTGNYKDWLLQQYKSMNSKELQRAKDMHAYFANVTEIVHNYMQEQDIYLGLFISNKAGCGKILMQELLNYCQERGLENMYLWTDTSCDFEYYNKNNFTLVHTIQNEHLQNDYAQYVTFIYKKAIQ